MSFVLSYVAGPRSTNDRAVINKALNSSDGYLLSQIANNPHLTVDDVIRISNEHPEVNADLARRNDCPISLLEDFLSDKDEYVRVMSLANNQTPLDKFTEAVVNGTYALKGRKYKPSSLSVLSQYEILCMSFEAFEFLWLNAKSERENLIRSVEYGVTDFLNGSLQDTRFSDLVASTILSDTNRTRDYYAGSYYITDPAVLDLMKDDKYREVINSIAQNKKAWVSTHDYLVSKHKSPGIRTSVASVTKDNALLNKIYRSTKSAGIRDAVVANPVFVEVF